MASDIGNFAVLTLPKDGGGVVENPPNSLEYTYVASAINIALAMLESQQGRDALTDLTIQLDSRRPATLGGPTCHGNHTMARAQVDIFLRKIRAQFPPIVINYTMTNIDNLGVTMRPPWDGHLEDFNPKTSMMYLNGSRVSDMLAASSSSDMQRFRDFQFLFATTLVHEAGGHLLMAFLWKGRLITPSGVSAPGYGTDRAGESGRWLELRLFGGTTEYYRDPSQNDQQTGIPHQLDDAGEAWELHPSTINQICQYCFIFPFQRTGSPVDRHTMQSMGRNSSPEPSNSHDRAMQARQLQTFRSLSLSDVAGFTVNLRDLMAIPTNPRQQVRVA